MYRQSQELTISHSIEYFLRAGVPASKLVMGIPLYGRSFTLRNANTNGVGAPINGPGIAGPYTRTAGALGYNEICERLKSSGYIRVWDSIAQVPYAHSGNQWISYDDVQSVKIKAEYVRKMGLGGAMVWSIETDDFRGVCGTPWPLLTVVHNVVKRTGYV